MGCLSCGRGFHSECKKCRKNKCHNSTNSLVQTFNLGSQPKEKRGVGAPVKDPTRVRDRFSTGRKRAALLYPLFEDKPCEWQGRKNCGGGSPIVGCISGKQQARHHGPVKDTLRNEPGNVHRICTACHNRWHSVNDSLYNEEEYEKLPHSPEPATEIELVANEAKWRIRH